MLKENKKGVQIMLKENKKGLLGAILVLGILLVFAGNAWGASLQKTISVRYDNIAIYADGIKLELTDAEGNTVEPFTYNGAVYLPLRAAGEALGKNVEWDGANKIVSLNSGETVATQNTADGFTFSTKFTTTYNDSLDWTQTTGEITNKSGQDCTLIAVSVTYYGEDGTILGKGSTFVQDLKVGQSKTFETIAQGDFTKAAKAVFQVDYTM